MMDNNDQDKSTKKQTLYAKVELVITIILFLVIFVATRVKYTNDYYELKHNYGLTVGITKGMNYKGQTGRYIKYEYCVKGKTYSSDQDYRNWSDIDRQEGGYIVVYSKKNPDLNVILFDEEIKGQLCAEIDSIELESTTFSFWKVSW